MGSGADKDWNELEPWQDNNALAKQEGGSHYKNMIIQPVEFIVKNNLAFLEANVIKYVCRHRNKNGLEDLNKAIHYLELAKELYYGKK
jgi:hypothetical protein